MIISVMDSVAIETDDRQHSRRTLIKILNDLAG